MANALILLGCGPSGAGGGGDLTPQNLQATAGDRSANFTWDADANAGYVPYFNTVDDFSSAAYYSLMGVIPSGSTSASIPADDTQVNYNTTPPPQTGSKYYYWLVGTDGAGTPVTGPSNSVACRAYVTLGNGISATLNVPDGAASMLINDLLFASSVLPPGVNLLSGANVYSSSGDGQWEDAIMGGIVNPPISGSFSVENFSGDIVTFWNVDP